MNLSVLSMCMALTVIELGAAVAAERYLAGQSRAWLLIGVGLFVILFYVYLFALNAASLTVVTVGWIVLSQMAAVTMDRFLYGHALTPRVWLGLALVTVGSLLLA